MKWTNPGHQLDEIGKQLLKVKNIYIYGTGEISVKAYNCLKWLGVDDDFNVVFVSDESDINNLHGRDIINFRDLCDKITSIQLETSIVVLYWHKPTDMADTLQQLGFNNIFYLTHTHNRRDNFIQNFLCVWLMYKHNKLLSHWTNFLTTSRCVLNCYKCLNCYYSIHEPRDITFEEFKEHIDIVFSKFDYLYSLHFSGGESFLVKELPKFVKYLDEKYKDRIFELFLVTSSMLLPDREFIDAMKSIGGSLVLNDYSANVHNTKVNEIVDILDANGIKYTINTPSEWMDLDFENTNNSHLSESELEEYKDDCNSFLHEFAEGRIYACCFQEYSYRAGFGDQSENDYIDISSTPKMEILEFRQGYTLKGYLDFCKTCRGMGKNVKNIAPAVQMPRMQTDINSDKLENNENYLISENNAVSICVPIYNTVKYLIRCIDSLLKQTYQNLEIILVDDGSNDGSETICDEYAKLDSRVVVIHKENGGEASARNAGLLAATGDYVMFIDSDDEYHPNAVELLVDAINIDTVDLAIGGYHEKTGETVNFATGHLQQFTPKNAARELLANGCYYGTGYILSTVNAKLFRRDLLHDNNILFDERFVVGNDTLFISHYLKYTRTVYDIFTPIYVYYKFHLDERVQGMAWFYPDSFYISACATDKRIKLADFKNNEFKLTTLTQYYNLLHQLVSAIANDDYFTNGFMPYLISLWNEVEFFRTGACLDLTEECCEIENVLPTKIISYMITNSHLDELYVLLKTISRTNGITPVKQKHTRLMVRLDEIKDILAHDEIEPSLSNMKLFLKQIDTIISTLNLSQQVQSATQLELNNAQQTLSDTQIELNNNKLELDNTLQAFHDTQQALSASQQALGEYHQALSDTQQALSDTQQEKTELDNTNTNLITEVHNLKHSTSWQITKPLRGMRKLLSKH